VHGGARRSSLLFARERGRGVLDFDSAHPDVRMLDLAVAVHDVGKVYTRPGEADHKVALNLDRIADLIAAYAREVAPTSAELRALPLLFEAKRLKLVVRVRFPSPVPRLSAGQLACQAFWRSFGGASG